MKIMDCTLRDGANVVGNGFSKPLTTMILDGLTSAGIPIIEIGNAKGIGAYEVDQSIAPLTDREYLETAKPYLEKAQVGMFLNAGRFRREYVELAKESGLCFLRVGAAAGDADRAKEAVSCVKENGMLSFYALMKAYLLTPEAAAEEAKKLVSFGVDELTIMDSAGTMRPSEVTAYVTALKRAVEVPVGFHGHNNLGLAAANAYAAYEAGADILDCGLLGMARSAGNIPTEVVLALLRREGLDLGIDFYGLLQFLDKILIPAMEREGYHPPICPLDLILGYSGAHSAFEKKFKAVAAETGVDLFRLIAEVSETNRKNPDEVLMRSVAKGL